jgi:hypothetical protein
MVCMTTVLFLSALLVSLAGLGLWSTPRSAGRGPLTLVRHGVHALTYLGATSWSARQTIA